MIKTYFILFSMYFNSCSISPGSTWRLRITGGNRFDHVDSIDALIRIERLRIIKTLKIMTIKLVGDQIVVNQREQVVSLGKYKSTKI